MCGARDETNLDLHVHLMSNSKEWYEPPIAIK